MSRPRKPKSEAEQIELAFKKLQKKLSILTRKSHAPFSYFHWGWQMAKGDLK